MIASRTALFDQVVDITEEYLGPASNRFVERQVTFHLNKKPNQLTKKDLDKLAEWIKVSMALLTEDKKIVDDCEKQILALGN